LKVVFMDEHKKTSADGAAKPAQAEKQAQGPDGKPPQAAAHAERQAQGPDGKPSWEPARQEPATKKAEPSEPAEQIAELADRLLRLTAEYDNYKKRTAKEKEALSLHSEARVMLRLLPIYEEIGIAEQEVAKIQDKPVPEGALLVLAKLRKGFLREGLQPMKLQGEKLDPFRHETAMREDSDAPEGTIVRVIKQGYLYKGEVLQHAIVSVSSGKKPGEKPEDGEIPENNAGA